MSSFSPPAGGIAKVLVVGDVATGKTSVIKRYVRNQFSKDYQTTIGVDFALRRVTVGDVDINVQLWDIAGQERFSGLSRIFYTHAVAAIIVYDLYSRNSFESAAKWKTDIDRKVYLPSETPIPVLLLGNKSDLVTDEKEPVISEEEAEKAVAEHKFFAHYRCSAKTGENVKIACNALVQQIALNNESEKLKQPAEPDDDESQRPVNLDDSGSNEGGGGCC